MNRFEEQFTHSLKELRDIAIPEHTRSRMREELLTYAELHGYTNTPTLSRRVASLGYRFYAGISAALLVVATLGGTAYASEKALPGDTLYPIKVGIAEPIQTALVPSDRGKAAWHAILAERRLEETAKLAAEGKLSTTTQDKLAKRFISQVSASQESADKLEEGGDVSGSLSARSDLEARLAAHLKILAVIDSHYAGSTAQGAPGTHSALSRMLALLEDNEEAVVSSRMALENALAPDAPVQASATSTAVLAVANKPQAKVSPQAAVRMPQTPAAQVRFAQEARTLEVESIIDRHAALLAKFLVSSTTATTTATSTASTTEEVPSSEAAN